MTSHSHQTAAQEAALSLLRGEIRAVSAPPLKEPSQILVDALAEKHTGASVLFYGSGASVAREDDPSSVIYDFYVIGESYDALYASSMMKLANKLIPPNVFYFETPSPFGILRAKYAVLSIDHFEKLASAETFHSYFWARFAQPCRIHSVSPEMTARLETALANSIAVFCKHAAGLVGRSFTARELWLAGLGASYKAELRAEDETRAGKLIDNYGGWTANVTAPALTYAGLENTVEGGVITLKEKAPDTALGWRLRAMQGASLSVLRLLKGTQTFKGGIDYIAWKINRHSGVDLQITDWERRHPLLGAPGAALRYYRLRGQDKKGA
ncbi:hypothetical protein [Hyphococcus sp.]|jgi:hypothetical protein|uniref:hypothetical protein n=1 Tax=Hyphococcus sp. TaxID=2038636 RepID=UPI003D146616